MTRRRFIVTTALAGGGLLAGYTLLREPDRLATPPAWSAAGAGIALNAWLRIAADDTVTVAIPRAEMGQGVQTGLAALVAEELDVDWAQIRVEPAPLEPVYANIAIVLEGLPFADDDERTRARIARVLARRTGAWLAIQVTGGSTSMRDAWHPLRAAGASARALLVAAAARRWDIAAAACTTRSGSVRERDGGRAARYGVLVEAAARLTPPASIVLKPRAQHHLIGTRLPRLDTAAKVTGAAVFGVDVRLPGLLHAALRLAPTFGGSVRAFAAAAVLTEPGVHAVVGIPGGVAVVADHWWQARRAADRLEIDFDAGPHTGLDTAALTARIDTAIDRGPADVYEDLGDAAAVLDAASGRIGARYAVPLLAHACMEPMNATARIADGRCEIWVPSQAPSLVRRVAAQAAGIDEEAVTVHTPFLGGGFGRRAETDTVAQVVAIARATGGRPVQMLWSREQDLRHDVYRPAAACRFEATLDAAGRPQAWWHRIACPSVTQSFMQRLWPIGASARKANPNVEGAVQLPYAIPNRRVEHVNVTSPVPVGFWRSVGHSFNAFFTECFIDELAHAAGADPYSYRRALLGNRPRHRRVIDLLADRSDWSRPPPAGRGRGMALHESFGSIVGQVAEVSVDAGRVRVHRVVCVIDCGVVVTPDIVVAQMQSGIVFGLAAALDGVITLRAGAVEQGNFDDYPVLAPADCPRVETYVIAGGDEPGGVGEPGTPPIAPAVANALFALTGTRIRTLPIRL
ncbi:MAG: xanthine dehydrogenase family protein molybdopterin-binding subunit [Gammaproteobacteria bacterium]|nr:xanthine dehydrogenase family protein molybdopterin-binding subunit [Gammaproteobacteria bacterium]